jgi:hypothetical protein
LRLKRRCAGNGGGGCAENQAGKKDWDFFHVVKKEQTSDQSDERAKPDVSDCKFCSKE